MRSLTKRTVLLLGAVGLAAAAACQPFGRFGFVKQWHLPGLIVSATGVKASTPDAVELSFLQSLPTWQALKTSSLGQTVQCGDSPQLPSSLEANLLSPGVILGYHAGLTLVMKTDAHPFLTWPSGSVADGVPTPPSAWVLLSFDKAQPPVLLSMRGDAKAVFEIDGGPGEWHLSVKGKALGRLRVCYPFGTTPWSTATAGDLGKLAAAFMPSVAFWTGPSAHQTRFRMGFEKAGIVAEWDYDHPAIVPPPAVTSKAVGKVSVIETTQAVTAEGQVYHTFQNSLKLFFPYHPFPQGRQIVQMIPAAPTPSPIDVAAIESLDSSDLSAYGTDMVDARMDVAAANDYRLERWTNKVVPFKSDGTGLTAAAAIALSERCQEHVTEKNFGDSFASDLEDAFDWYNWSFLGERPGLAELDAAIAFGMDDAAGGSSPLFGAMLFAAVKPHLQLPEFAVADQLFGMKRTKPPLGTILSPYKAWASAGQGHENLYIQPPGTAPFTLIVEFAPGVKFSSAVEGVSYNGNRASVTLTPSKLGKPIILPLLVASAPKPIPPSQQGRS